MGSAFICDRCKSERKEINDENYSVERARGKGFLPPHRGGYPVRPPEVIKLQLPPYLDNYPHILEFCSLECLVGWTTTKLVPAIEHWKKLTE